MSLAEHSEVWPEVELGEVCEFAYGKSLPAKSRTGSGYPVYGSNGPVGLHEEALTAGETIVIGRKGSFGEVHYSPGPCSPIDTTYYITQEQTKAYLPWLARRLRCLDLDQLNRAAAIPGLNRADAYRQTLLRPPLDQQKRIAGILDAADALRAKRREALAQLDTLLQSTFLDMFGDPVRSGWTIVTVEAVASSQSGAIRTGPFGSQLLHSEFVDEGIRVLGIDNAVANEFRAGKPRFITAQKYDKLRRYTVRPGDILITIMGTCGMGECTCGRLLPPYALFDLESGVPTDAYELETAVADGFLVPPRVQQVDLQFPREGIDYDSLSDEEKEQWESLDWGDDVDESSLPDKVNAAALNSWLFNKDTVDKVLQHLRTAERN